MGSLSSLQYAFLVIFYLIFVFDIKPNIKLKITKTANSVDGFLNRNDKRYAGQNLTFP